MTLSKVVKTLFGALQGYMNRYQLNLSHLNVICNEDNDIIMLNPSKYREIIQWMKNIAKTSEQLHYRSRPSQPQFCQHLLIQGHAIHKSSNSNHWFESNDSYLSNLSCDAENSTLLTVKTTEPTSARDVDRSYMLHRRHLYRKKFWKPYSIRNRSWIYPKHPDSDETVQSES